MLTYADRSSDFKFQEFARLTQEADSLQTRADALLSRADTIDGLIQSTQNDLGEKRKEFEHYKNRAQVIAASSKCSTVVCREILDPSTDNLLHVLDTRAQTFCSWRAPHCIWAHVSSFCCASELTWNILNFFRRKWQSRCRLKTRRRCCASRSFNHLFGHL